MAKKKMSLILYVFTAFICFNLASGVNNGQLADIKNFKYVVAIKSHTITEKFSCTGGIIHQEYILTAAHCFTNDRRRKNTPKGDYKYADRTVHIYAGTDNIKVISDNAILAKPTHVYFTRDYLNRGTDDIAVVKLDRSFNFESSLKMLQLPKKNVANGKYDEYINAKAVIAGYGIDPEGDHKDKDNKGSLRKVYSQTIDRLSCEEIYTRQGIAVDKTKNLCTVSYELNSRNQYKHVDYPLGTCEGDSGAPIVLQDEYTVIGVVSRGLTCDSRVDPELHMNVAAYVDDFINPILQGNYINLNRMVVCFIKSKSCTSPIP